MICGTTGGEGLKGSGGVGDCLFSRPIDATVDKIVTIILATTGALVKYSGGEEIRRTSRAQMRVVATNRWRPVGLIEIIIHIDRFVNFPLLVWAWFLR